ncbi:MAG: hypothetical protein PHV37_00620 [Candidatus Gastranaerophilales bacterium]|nr:hypothetical protein [Candidatus Gastranaerophilales bacterium]
MSKESIITALYHWVTTFKNKEIVKDMTKLRNVKFDAMVESSITEPLSFTVFELSDKGELLIDDTARLIGSEAAFFLFVNSKTGWIFAIKNTLENQKKLIRKEPIQNFKIKIG